MLKRIKTYIILCGALFVFSCAQQGNPSGGPKDLEPPKVLETRPENYSTHFTEKKISIVFNEYLDMGNFTQELVVSPPMDEKPVVKLKNKTLIIDFEEELKKEVTYTFNFGDGIKDLNEKNVLQNYEYVFSTGDYLDSLSVKGTLRNAFDLSKPEGQVTIMLYNEQNDSLPLKQIPYYIGRSDVDGNFAVNNLRPDVYKMFVLKDANNNFLYDTPSEEIAFLDSSIALNAVYIQKMLLESGKYDSTDLAPDTIGFYQDTVGLSADSISMYLDSVNALKPDWNSIYVDLLMFTEEEETQYISEYSREDRRKPEVLFNRPLSDTFSIHPVFPESLTDEDFILELGVNRDSLVVWPGDTLIAAMDTITMLLSYTVLDTLNNFVMRPDTIAFVYRERNTNKDKEKEKENTEVFLNVATIKNNARQHLHQGLLMEINEPLDSIEPEKFQLFEIPDSVEIPVTITPIIDSNHLRRTRIDVKWKESMKYRFVMYPGALNSIYGTQNDTIDISFRTKALADYGKIILQLENVEDDILIELYKKDKVFRKMSIDTSGEYTFSFLDAETYRIKFVHDANKNGKWDTGKYLKKLQPEKVEFLPKDIAVRANWDHDASYVMGSNDEPPASSKPAEEKGGEKEKRPEVQSRGGLRGGIN